MKKRFQLLPSQQTLFLSAFQFIFGKFECIVKNSHLPETTFLSRRNFHSFGKPLHKQPDLAGRVTFSLVSSLKLGRRSDLMIQCRVKGGWNTLVYRKKQALLTHNFKWPNPIVLDQLMSSFNPNKNKQQIFSILICLGRGVLPTRYLRKVAGWSSSFHGELTSKIYF